MFLLPREDHPNRHIFSRAARFSSVGRDQKPSARDQLSMGRGRKPLNSQKNDGVNRVYGPVHRRIVVVVHVYDRLNI